MYTNTVCLVWTDFSGDSAATNLTADHLPFSWLCHLWKCLSSKALGSHHGCCLGAGGQTGPAGAELCAASTSSCLGNGNSHSPRISLKEQACMLWKTVLLEKEDFCFEWCMAVVRQGMLIPWNCQKNASAN